MDRSERTYWYLCGPCGILWPHADHSAQQDEVPVRHFEGGRTVRAGELDHKELLELDPTGGVIHFAGQRALLLDGQIIASSKAA